MNKHSIGYQMAFACWLRAQKFNVHTGGWKCAGCRWEFEDMQHE